MMYHMMFKQTYMLCLITTFVWMIHCSNHRCQFPKLSCSWGGWDFGKSGGVSIRFWRSTSTVSWFPRIGFVSHVCWRTKKVSGLFVFVDMKGLPPPEISHRYLKLLFLKRRYIFQTIMFGIYVNFQGCIFTCLQPGMRNPSHYQCASGWHYIVSEGS